MRFSMYSAHRLLPLERRSPFACDGALDRRVDQVDGRDPTGGGNRRASILRPTHEPSAHMSGDGRPGSGSGGVGVGGGFGSGGVPGGCGTEGSVLIDRP
jgi:hypothetical protein